jgi:hypothetical protein
LTPEGTIAPIVPRDVGGKVLLRAEGVATAGVHMFVSGDDTLGVFAVNPDPLESDLAPASREEIERYIPAEQLRLFSGDESLERQVSEARVGREIWKFGIFAVILLLGAELFVGRGKRLEG